jgi:hypothetical protein
MNSLIAFRLQETTRNDKTVHEIITMMSNSVTTCYHMMGSNQFLHINSS